MTREDIFKLAIEAGFEMGKEHIVVEGVICTEELERFAALVAAHEREECAKVCIDTGAQAGVNDSHFEMADLCAEVIKARGKQ